MKRCSDRLINESMDASVPMASLHVYAGMDMDACAYPPTWMHVLMRMAMDL